jgi:hypothetical protein
LASTSSTQGHWNESTLRMQIIVLNYKFPLSAKG